MRGLLGWLSALSLFGACARVAAQAPVPRPNILLILADDLGWRDVGFNGSDFYETPNIDRMAREGTVFRHAYAAAGNCAPSRACLLSGNYTPRHEVYAVGSTDRGPKQNQRLIPIPNRSGLAPENVTVADALKQAGYATGIFGKWHLGGPEGAPPGRQGFDTVFDSRQPDPNRRRDEPEDPKGIVSLTRKTIEFIENSKRDGKPFFAYLAHHAIHTALESRPASLARFQAKARGAQHGAPLYAACLYDLDAGVGRLVDKLDELGLSKNTLVVFTSDNGGTQQSSQEPLRGNKGGYYEGGIREPYVARWPGVIPAGRIDDTPIIHTDLFPTFLAAAKAETPPGKTLDGVSLLPLFRGEAPLSPRPLFWHFPGYLDNPVIRARESDRKLGFRSRPTTVIRDGNWKLHLFHEEWALEGGRAGIPKNQAVELYDLSQDPGERHDLASERPEERDRLLAELLSWVDRIGAKIPRQPNPAFKPTAASGAD